MDTKDASLYDWVERGCITSGNACTEGERETSIIESDWVEALSLSTITVNVSSTSNVTPVHFAFYSRHPLKII